MEGYTDVIVAHQYGFTNAVAVLGTALGESHIRLLKAHADRIVLVLDGDEAGTKRANEVLELFIAQQVDLRILTLPEDLDPCDYLHKYGAEAFRDLLDNKSVDALDHAFEVTTRGIDVERDIHGAGQAIERLLGIVAKAPRLGSETRGDARIQEQKIVQRLAAKFRVDEQDLRRRLAALRRRAATRRHAAPHPVDAARGGASRKSNPPSRPIAWELAVLQLIVAHPESFCGDPRKFQRGIDLSKSVPADLRNLLPVERRGHRALVRPADARVRRAGDPESLGRDRRDGAGHRPAGRRSRNVVERIERDLSAKGDREAASAHRSARCAREV